MHVSENETAIASTHPAFLAPAGRATHTPPLVAHASSQLCPSAPSCHCTPVLPHSPSAGDNGDGGGAGGAGGGDGEGGRSGGDGGRHGQKRWKSARMPEHKNWFNQFDEDW